MRDRIRKWEIVSPDDSDQDNGTKFLNYCIVIGPGQDCHGWLGCSPIFDYFFQHLWPYIGNNTANVVFQMVKRLWLIRIDHDFT
ncbi:hypothetical protein TNCV_3084481 [Trichonephila clavipes]|nr:hypothetical protein TNCV_3084481 [Trichonephila clavipes]